MLFFHVLYIKKKHIVLHKFVLVYCTTFLFTASGGRKKKYFHQSSNLVKIHFLFSYFKYHIDYNLFDLV